MRKKNTEPMEEVINQYLRAIGADVKLKEIRLKRNWEEIIGGNIAKKTEKILIKDSVFHIKVSSSIVKSELLMIKQEIIRRLNAYAGETIIRDFKVY